MHSKSVLRPLLLALACGSFAMTAFAQWQWIDKDGRKVYSDRSPPSDILEKNILKRPGGMARTAVPAESAANTGDAATPATPGASAAPGKASAASAPKLLSGKDKELEAKKKQADNEEAAKKKAEEEKQAKTKADACDRAKQYLGTLQSGVRIGTTNTKGEREIMDDAKRAEESKRAQGIADASCSK
ncbi:MAG: DUF4124 domain-containing protein [Polaromonas sp.]|uniref:DUF4124 domain-containing protein n=1 Tax=Polaromonas sp. TaxID=1869339 RepID=UPI00326536DC